MLSYAKEAKRQNIIIFNSVPSAQSHNPLMCCNYVFTQQLSHYTDTVIPPVTHDTPQYYTQCHHRSPNVNKLH